MLVAAGALVAGALFGTGLTRTSIDIGDGLTWFSDSPSGEVIQVNPATGRPEARIDVSKPGNTLEVSQLPGRLFVTNRTTGQLVSFDLTSILTSGQRRVTPGAATDVLHHGDDVFLVDRERGTIAAIDPVSTDTIGEIWQSPEGISDAVLDGTGELWSVDQKGLLSQLRWSSREGAFVTEDERTVDHSGARSVLVGHDRGVTLFGPDQGIVVQVGTGSDEEVVAGAPRLSGELEVPEFSPSSMVPVSAPQTGTVAIVSEGAVHEVDVTAIGCERPQRPEAFQGTVYVPCSGDEKVVRLDPTGSRAGDDIELPEGGEPSLVMDDGRLLINVPGAEHGVSVAEDGTVSTIVRIDESLPAVSGDPADVPTIDPGTIDSVANADAGTAPTTLPTSPPPPPTPPVCVGKKRQCHPTPSSSPTQTPTPTDNEPDESDSEGPQSPTDSPSSSEPTGFPTIPGTQGLLPGGPSDSPTSGGSHGGGDHGDDDDPGGWPTPGDSEGDDAPLSAPTGVRAQQLQSGEVQVSWSFDTQEPVDGFTVQEYGAVTSLATVSAGVRQASITVAPGSHRFSVTALRTGTTPKTSTASGTIQTADRPGAPQKVDGSVTGSASSTEATIELKWAAGESGGSDVIDYTVQARDRFGTHELTVRATSAAYKVDCGDTYCDPGPVSVSVTARNNRGSGPAATTTLTYSGPQRPPLPSQGAQLVQSDSTSWNAPLEGSGTTTLTLSPPADWASFDGTCSWTHTGNRGGAGSGTFNCNAGAVDVPIENGVIEDPNSGETSHSIVFHASNSAGSVDSAPYPWVTQQQTNCNGCPLP